MNKEKYLEFGLELAKAIEPFEEYATYSFLQGNRFRFENYSIELQDLADSTDLEMAEIYLVDEESSLEKFRGPFFCCYLSCEGDLYGALYYYEAYGKNLLGEGDEAKNLYNQVFSVCNKYHLDCDFDSGALGFSESRY